MNVGDFRTLYAFNRWANRRTIDSCRALDPKKFEGPSGGSFGSIKDTLAHIASAEWLWLRLTERIAYQNIKGETWEYTLGQMLQHTANHSTYHGGQIVTLLRQAGAAASSTDYLLWLDSGMPA